MKTCYSGTNRFWKSARIIHNGIKDYYNFIRPHQGLDGKTPAEVAGIEMELGENR